MAFRSAATTVVARLFQLLDSTGFVRFAFDKRTLPTFSALAIDGYAVEYDTPEWTDPNTRTGLISSGNPDTGSVDLARTAVYSDINHSLARRYLSYLQSSAQYAVVPADDYAQAEMLAGARDSGVTATIRVLCRPTSSVALISSTDGLFVDLLRVIGSTVWTNLPAPSAGFANPAAPNFPQWKTCDGRTYLRGEVHNVSGVNQPPGQLFPPGSIPAAARPISNRISTGAVSGAGLWIPGSIDFKADGEVRHQFNVPAFNIVRLDNCSWETN